MSLKRLFDPGHLKKKIAVLAAVGILGIVIFQAMISNSDHSIVQRFDENHASHNAPRGVMATDGNKVFTGTPTPGRVSNANNLLSTDVTGLFEQLFRRTTPPMKKLQEVIHFEDGKHHVHDESKVANDLAKKIRLLCWVMTSPENHQAKAIHVKETWGKRCDKLLFASEKDDGTLPFIVTPVEHGRDHLTAKTMAAFDYVYKHHLDEYDWFLKADDDTYVIVENMKYFLSSQDPTKPVFFGHHFKPYVKQGYFSGGAGYIMSKEALRRFGNRQPNTCSKDQGAEDVEMGRCMEILGVVAGDSRDVLGRSRFHCFDPETHIHGGYPDWYLSYDKHGSKKGIESISDYAITFHYVSVQKMYDLEFYIYHLRPYGIISGLQELNVPAAGANLGQPISSMAPPTDTPKPEKQPTSTLPTNPDDNRIEDNPPKGVERTPAVQVSVTGANSVNLDKRTVPPNGSPSTVDQTVLKSPSGEIEDRKLPRNVNLNRTRSDSDRSSSEQADSSQIKRIRRSDKYSLTKRDSDVAGDISKSNVPSYSSSNNNSNLSPEVAETNNSLPRKQLRKRRKIRKTPQTPDG